MIILGIILMIIGFVAAIPVLWTIGIILLVVGLILSLMGAMGRAVGGRRTYYCPGVQPSSARDRSGETN